MNGRSDLPTGWKVTQLGSVAQLSGRIGWKGLTAKEYTKEGPMFLSVHSLNHGDYVDYRDAFHISQERYDESPEIMLRLNDVLICKDGAGIGKVGIVGELPGPSTINSSLLLVRASESILPKYLFYALSSPYFQSIVKSRLMGATTPHLYQRDIAQFPIYLPSLAEQQRIVSVLDEVFGGLAISTVNAKKNLNSARQLFDSYLDSIFEKKSGAWHARLLEQLCDRDRIITYGVIKLGKGIPGGVPCLRTSNVRRLLIDTDGIKSISPSLSAEYDRTILQGGEVLVNVRGTLGGVAVATPDMKGWNVSREVAVVPVDPSLIEPAYLAYFIAARQSQDWLANVQKGLAYIGINIADLRTLPISFPNRELQIRLVKQFEGISAESRRLEAVYLRRLSQIEELKQSILQRAFAGGLTRPSTAASVVTPTPKPERSLVSVVGISSTDLHAGIIAIAFQKHQGHRQQNTFGRVKAEKIAHLVEARAGIELGRRPIKDAAGPNDYRHLMVVESRAEKAGFFSVIQTKSGSYSLVPKSKFDSIVNRTRKCLGERISLIDGIVDEMVPMKTEQAEIFATVYSAWNNLIMEGKDPTDETIVREARENWHPAKLKISRERFVKAISWMRRKGIVPTGTGKRVLDRKQ